MEQSARISTVALAATTTLSYTIDNANRITALSQTGTGFTNKTYGYDTRDHLTSFFNGTTTGTYTYDANGNRLTSALSGTTTYHYTSNTNQLSSLSGTTSLSYSTDSDGHITGDGTNTWTYDTRERMSQVVAGGVTTHYGINALGQRISKWGSGVSNGGTNEYVYDQQGHLIGEYDNSGNIIEETVYLGDLPVAVLTGTGMSAATFYITPDNLGAPNVITNSGGTKVWVWDHQDFGNSSPNQNPSGLGTFSYNLRYPGQYYDAETGLYYNLNRDYNPAIGRYVQSDPIGLLAGINTYGYVGSNPLLFADPLGLLNWLERQVLKNSFPQVVSNARNVINRLCGEALNADQKDQLLESVLESITEDEAQQFTKISPNADPIILTPQQEKIVQNQINQIDDPELKKLVQQQYNDSKKSGRVLEK